MRGLFGGGRGFGGDGEGDGHGFGGGGPPRHGRGGGGRHGRGFGHGGLRLVLLRLLEERPRHGYELIREIEERSQGRYVPSPGVIYPALSWLEDGGLILIEASVDGRKLARITATGQRFLTDNAAEVARLMAMMQGAGGEAGAGPGDSPEFAPIFRAMNNLKGALRTRALRPLSKPELEAIVDWIDDLARKIERQ